MATAPDQGIMSLPQAEQAPPPQLSLNEAYGAVQQGLQNASPDASQAVKQTLDQLAPMMDQLDDKTLDGLLQLIQYLMEHEADYEKLVAQLVQEGNFQAGVFPEQYDPEFLSTFGMMIMHAKQARMGAEEPAPEMTPPATMARGGIAEAARTVARQGRGNDTLLAHITPREAHILRAHGGLGTRNPSTGMLEFDIWDDIRKPFKAAGDFVGDVIKGAGDVIKEVVSSPIGKILATVALATFLGPGAFGISGLNLGLMAAPLASAGVSLLGGGSIQDALISGATAYFGAPGGVVSNFVQSIGGVMVGTAANAALSAGLVGTGAGLLQGKSLADSVKSGLVAGAIGGGMAALPSLTSDSVDLTDPSPYRPDGAEGATIAETGVVAPEADVNSLMTPTVEAGGPMPVNSGTSTTLPPSDQIAPFTNENVFPKDGPNMSTIPGQQSRLQEALAGGPTSPATTQTGVAKPYAAPGIGESFEKMYEGVTSGNLEKLGEGASNLFSPGMSAADKDAAIQSYMDNKGMSYTEAAKRVADQSPGMLRTYGPMVGAGLAGLALTGGFDVKQPELTPEQQAMRDQYAKERADIAANPGKWHSQNLKGVTYDSRGVPTGSTPYDPSIGLPSSLVPATQRPTYSPPTYTTPSIGQPYNTPAGYPDLNQYLYKPPAKKAMGGGIGSLATGGYPRKTGAIAGPGTATSDSIPAMLSDGEFVMTAKAVRGAGKGSRLAGAKKMYALMHQLERNASRS